ncbi:hypothetical protein LCGC14_2826000, partial [marine sediment metagenome]
GQVYRRTSRRDSQGADVYTEFDGQTLKRNLADGEEYTCLFESTNDEGLPDYYVLSEADYFNVFGGTYGSVDDVMNELATNYSTAFNGPLPQFYEDIAVGNFAGSKNIEQSVIVKPGTEPNPPYVTDSVNSYDTITNLSVLAKETDPYGYIYTSGAYFYYEDGGAKNYLILKPSLNGDKCQGDANGNILLVTGPEGGVQTVDGGDYSATNPGVVDGTPTAVLTDNTIDQVVDGASLQLNWNTEKHKFMVGASVDRPTAKYETTQQLGLLTSDREFYYAPNEIRDQYIASDIAIANNNFEGEQLTKSLYFSETWSPVETWHFNVSARYNDTQGENRVRSRTYADGYLPTLARLEALPDYFNVCPPGEECETGYYLPEGIDLLNPEETESFSYYSLNPSFGVAWQA